jgi:cellulose synthase (UDP-forming)
MSFHNVIIFNVLLATGLGLLLWSLPVRRRWARSAVVLLLLVVTLNYTVWRVSSLPVLDFIFGSLWPWGFFAMEIITISHELWTYMVMTRRSDNTSEADLHEFRLRTSDDRPRVDVFIATYDEPLEILEKTIKAAKRLDYPRHRLQIIVGDDGDRPGLKSLAKELGVDYTARPRILNEHGNWSKVGGSGKAGNDRYTFTQTEGDYIILLDADFRVRPEFIYRTLGFLHFRADVGLVQTPQRFSNSDVIGHNLLAVDCVPEDQHFFMAITEPSRDAWRNSFCTGTGCVVSRRLLRLLNPVWGFPNHTICEDLELSYALLGAGYRTLYLNEPLAYGLAPESIPDFVKQRVRWCAGTVQNLYAPTGPIRGNLRLLDRIFYCEGVFYWLGFAFNTLLILAPLVFWFSGISAVLGTPEAAAAAVFPRLISREMTMYWLSEGKIPPLIVQVSRILPAFHVSMAFAKALLRPRSPVFNVTTKGQRRDQLVIRWPLFCTFLSIALATLYGMLVALVGRSELAPSSDLIQMNVAWSTLSAFVCLLCSLACVELPHTRGDGPEVVRSKPLKIAIALVNRCIGIGNPRAGAGAQGGIAPMGAGDSV